MTFLKRDVESDGKVRIGDKPLPKLMLPKIYYVFWRH